MKQSSQMTTWNVEMDTKIIHMGLLTSKEKTLKKCDMGLTVKKLVGVLASWTTWWYVFRDLSNKSWLSTAFLK